MSEKIEVKDPTAGEPVELTLEELHRQFVGHITERNATIAHLVENQGGLSTEQAINMLMVGSDLMFSTLHMMMAIELRKSQEKPRIALLPGSQVH